MSIKEYVFENQTLYKSYVSVYSLKNPSLRKQKEKKGIKTYREAQKIERQLMMEAQQELIRLELSNLSFGAILDKWEIALRQGTGVSQNVTQLTKEDYVRIIRAYATGFFKIDADRISAADIREALMQINEAGKSRARQQRFKTAIDALYKWAIETRAVHGVLKSPATGVGLVGMKVEKRPEILTLNEIRQLLSIAKATNHEWLPIWSMALLTGCRSGELFALEWTDVDLENSRLMIQKSFSSKTKSIGPTKGRYWREIPISTELRHLLAQLKLQYGNQKWVLPHFSDWNRGMQAAVLRQFCAGVGLPSINFHALRACFATQLIRDKVAPAIVMKICGWKDLKTMQRYIRYAGIEIEGATESLKILPSAEVMGIVVDLFAPPS